MIKINKLIVYIINKFKYSGHVNKKPPKVELCLIKNPIVEPQFKPALTVIDSISLSTPRDYVTSSKEILLEPTLNKSYFWVLIIISEIEIGYLRCNPFSNTTNGVCLEINEFVIKPDFQVKGYGKAALQELIYIITNNDSYFAISKIVLDCNSKKAWLINFYKAFGFNGNKYSSRNYTTPHLEMEYIIKR